MEQTEAARLKLRAALCSVLTALTIALLKFAAGLFTGSLAVIASAVDSLLDIGMSGINFFAIRQAEQPADQSHAFGHGKYETLATLTQSLVIAASGLWILAEAFRRLNDGREVQQIGSGIIVLALSVVASFAISRYLRRIGRLTDSSALEADALHYAMDIGSNGALLAGMIVLSFVDAPWLDPLMSIFVALYILREALRLVRHALREVLDEELPESVRNEVVRLVEAHRGELLDIHHLRTRRAGSQKIMDFHLTVCKHLTVQEAHDIADHLEKRIEQEIRGADVTIHIEPCQSQNCPGAQACPVTRTRIKGA